MQVHIRKSRMTDISQIMEIYKNARQFMAENGNAGQWINGYPDQNLVKQDIEKGCSYVCSAGDDIAAVFYFAIESEPTYAKIDGGGWINENPYGVVHRIAATGHRRGIATFCLNWCYRNINNIRIDTHRNNLPMQTVLKKNDFVYCGIVYMKDGSERLAFQKTEPPK
jgi:ABC-type amino acid transport system permease subunit